MGQRTIAEVVSCEGIGLHSGKFARVTLLPAPPETGVVLTRVDRPGAQPIALQPGVVTSTRFATSLGSGDDGVGTVEHLLAALYGLGIDNLFLKISGSEVPILDGSARPFVALLRGAGVVEQNCPRARFRVTRSVEVRDGERFVRVSPSRGLRASVCVDFPHPRIGRQKFEFDLDDPEFFEREIAPARTFGFLAEIEAMRAEGFAIGGSRANAIVLDDHDVLNRDGLRWPDEFARHKALDLIGDLATLGVRLEGRLEVERGGHRLHQDLVAQLGTILTGGGDDTRAMQSARVEPGL
ncbi:UDP-3-O-acyl-N-acetylglucosamine deacetylase [Myxococcota bacterium]|nr:UDP-3-O-acyl-N-acetylglucosamine deacetylase [Myxococcota bacterium]